ncbi:TPA: hypothetical protein MX372_004744 [Enterobacter roggenkampii]|jgi:hypothetical protein|uniref:hypothetical protein n=1 Tax=Enterobacteriaceae TaxID=543 RepID=UPI0015DC28E6|nr:hypothetical protein [Klebsiella sp. WP3-S18-ESBL-05]EJG2392128.1 hypothetical protein [Citrobacter freundii]MCA7374514.1 hypothetical protein [Escherichia coli]HCA7459915.1 hypothetical protein [Enterobacter roggenkampii]ELP5250212.1 hypothetical protein [Citrobacter freundii]MCA7862068.1 hypothetical protein [Escherichia coli]
MSEKITVIEAEVIPTPSDAATAVRYANELLELWMLHLDKPLRDANPRAGARFKTLISELRHATIRTELRFNRLVNEKEGKS